MRSCLRCQRAARISTCAIITLWKAIQDRLQPPLWHTCGSSARTSCAKPSGLSLKEIRRSICSWPQRLLKMPHGRWRTLRGLSRPISMAPCAKTRTNGVNRNSFLTGHIRHKPLCLPVICWSKLVFLCRVCWSKLVFICSHVCIFSTGSACSPLPSRCQCGWKALSLSPFCVFSFFRCDGSSTPTVATRAVFTST